METKENAEDVAIPVPNRRAHPRYAVDENATFLLLSQGSRIPCRVIELSLEGCRLRAGERFIAGTLIRVEVAFAINGIAFRFSGVTEWTDEEHVLGIRFIDVTSRRRDELAEVLCEVEADGKARAEKKAAERLAAEAQSAKEAPQERPQIQAVHQTAPQAVVPAATRAPQALPAVQSKPSLQPAPVAQSNPSPQPDQAPAHAAWQPAAKPVKRERRTQSRHEVDTSALIFLINVGSALRGRILDLSLGGCRIRTDERFPVGIYTRVETEFRLEGLPFRLGGVIQAVHDRDRHLVGIRFLDMSDRKQAQLEQLIEEIEEMEASRTGARTQESEQEVGKAKAL